MSNNSANCLVILAGGKSSRMGQDKAVLTLNNERLVDRIVAQFGNQVDLILLSASTDFETGLKYIIDDPDTPDGPTGAIFSVAAQLSKLFPAIQNFTTIPVDAPFTPNDLIERLSAGGNCTLAAGPERLHPTFAHWRCDVVKAIQAAHDPESKAPSLHWLARQCDATAVEWPEEQAFMNINTPEDLAGAERQIEKSQR